MFEYFDLNIFIKIKYRNMDEIIIRNITIRRNISLYISSQSCSKRLFKEDKIILLLSLKLSLS